MVHFKFIFLVFFVFVGVKLGAEAWELDHNAFYGLGYFVGLAMEQLSQRYKKDREESKDE